MNVNNQFDKRDRALKHTQEMKNLQNQQVAEIEKMKTNHQKLKNQIKVNNTLEKNSIHNHNQIEKAKQAAINEKAFEKMQTSLDQVKTRTQSEKDRIEKEHKGQLEGMKANFDSLANAKKMKNEHLSQDMDHQASLHINKLQRRIVAKENELKQTSSEDLANLRTTATSKKAINKQIYAMKQNAESEKFHNALINQRNINNKQLVREERQHQGKIVTRENVYNNQVEKLSKDHSSKQIGMQKNHEKVYTERYEKQEGQLQKLMGKKEKIINHLRKILKTEAKKEMELDNDPFYHYTDLKPDLMINENKDGYILKIDIPKHEAKNISLTGSERQLKISMDRNFDFTNKSDNGKTSTVKKIETYVSKIPTEYIIDSKSIEESYADGVLTYKIGFA